MNMIGRKLKMKQDSCFLCNGKGVVTQQKGFKYKQAKCSHTYDYNSALDHLSRAKDMFNEAKIQKDKFTKAINEAEII